MFSSFHLLMLLQVGKDEKEMTRKIGLLVIVL